MSTRDDALIAFLESLVETDVQRELLDAAKQAFGQKAVEVAVPELEEAVVAPKRSHR